jgi:2-polyprenyl-6-methoxyphenol hydroxylase-like FAD-dependent oxidoreductase
MSNNQQHIIVLGGGTAGWMTANLLQQQLAPKGFVITVVESEDIGIIGVGEGSTPQLKVFFDILGIDEQQWMPQCDATYKHGITFHAWTTGESPLPHTYFHPFPSSLDNQTAGAFLRANHQTLHNQSAAPHPSQYFLAHHLTQQKRSPHLLERADTEVKTTYGYHFDSYKLGAFLKHYGTQQGIQTRTATIASVQQDERGISSLTTTDNNIITGDWFFDCSGFQSLLLQQTLGVEFESFAAHLFNDCAIATPTPCGIEEHPHTQATALRCGWAWRIPLQSRVGNGYVFSSRFCDFEEAEHELAQHLGLDKDSTSFRRIRMKVGQVKQHWYKNCVAVGLAQGFIEPLEATALHLVQETVTQFIGAFTAGQFSQHYQAQFNKVIRARFNGVKDYINGHYILNKQTGPYWQACREKAKVTPHLQQIILCWQRGGDLHQLLTQLDLLAYYPTVSWYCLLSGYQHFPTLGLAKAELESEESKQIKMFLEQQAEAFSSIAT